VDLVPVDLDNLEPEILSVRAKAKVDDERFKGGIQYSHLVIDGVKPNQAYMKVFGVDANKARTVSSQFHRSKWVQQLILFLTPDDGTINQSQCRTVINRLMAIIESERTSPREKTEAAKALQPYIKQEKKVENEFNFNHNEVSVTEQASAKLLNGIEQLANSGKMVGENGDIIDVPIIY